MAIVVEDGTAKADAETFISVADADTYHSARGNADWAALATAAKEAALRKAADYMTQTYRLRWKGVRVTSTQALDWPRYGVEREDYYVSPAVAPESLDGFYYPSDEVPAEIARACAELALKASSAELLADLDAPVVREKVGPIETEYAVGARQTVRYEAVDRMLAPFLKRRGMAAMVVRA